MIKFVLNILDHKQKLLLIVLIIFSLISSIVEVAGIASVYPMIQILLDDDILNNEIYLKYFSNIFSSKNQLLYFSLITIFLIFLLKNLIVFFVKYLQFSFAYKLKVDILKKLSRGILFLPFSQLSKKTTDENLRNFDFVNEFPSVVAFLLIIFTETSLLLFIIFFLFLISPKMLFIVLIFLGLSLSLIYKSQKNVFYNLGDKHQFIKKNYMKNILELIRGMREIKIMKKENIFINRISKTLKNLGKIRFKSDVLLQIPAHLIEIIVILSIVLIVYILYQQNLSELEIASIMGSFVIAFVRLMPSSTRILSSLNALKYQLPQTKILFKEFNIENYQRQTAEKKRETLINLKKSVRIKNLNFSYTGRKKVLNNLNFEVKKGQCIGIYGSSGQGKTTFNNLISGLLTPNNGEIFVDDLNIIKTNTNWSKKVAYIPQTPFFLNGSIIENITFFSEKKIIKRKVINSLKNSGLYNSVINLPKKLNTIIGEDGNKLSTGQLQRLSIARALYLESDLIICDEATNSLDAENEKVVLNSLNKLKQKGKTIIIISHDVRVFYFCDKIFKLKDGNLINVKKSSLLKN